MKRWQRRVLSKFLEALGAAFGVLVVTFMLVRLVPGDPATGLLGARATPEAAHALREQLHLNEPLVKQFWLYVSGVFRGDLGRSVTQQHETVVRVLASSLPITLSIVVSTVVISALIGIPLGLFSAMSPRRGVDLAVRSVTVVSLAMPQFFIALILLLVFALTLAWLPAGGWGSGWPDNFRFIVLPSLALCGYMLPLITRTVRQAARNVTGQQFVEAAVSRGLSSRVVVWKHILPNSLLPVITLVGINLGALLTGAVVVEAVFGLPGMGTELVNAVGIRDYPIIQGIATASALAVVFVSFAIDALYLVIDPRTRR